MWWVTLNNFPPKNSSSPKFMNPRGTLINEQELLEGKNHVKLHHSYIFFLYQLGMTTIFATTPLQKNKQKKETVQSVAEHTCSTPTPKKKKKAE